MKTKFKVTWSPLLTEEIDFEEYFNMSVEEFKELSVEEQEDLERDVIDILRDEIVIQVQKTEIYENI